MPCRSEGDDPSYQLNATSKELKLREAMLCAVLTVLENNWPHDWWSMVDYTEGGFTKQELKNWWSHHQAIDRERKFREEQARKEEELVKSALTKLTDDEYKALHKRGLR